MHTVEDLDGNTVARAFCDRVDASLTLLSPSGFVDGKYYPAESIALSGVDSIIKLHQLLGDLIREHREQQ